ncbi:hypothetical protein [Streptomyces halobius]|uniref:MFS transporter n=1 Tax=Streptomyces halobius TaxID=2879846 RepID=A0ABY4LZR8_9ACTN|nr:hypothetical protein [Streptomyces halobius]UQA90995.1 hypothetical protein K9S39_03060 [Streptomyces halobius]
MCSSTAHPLAATIGYGLAQLGGSLLGGTGVALGSGMLRPRGRRSDTAARAPERTHTRPRVSR